MRQSTLRQPAVFSGVGLHTGEDCRVAVIPAPSDTGIVFRRQDNVIDAADASVRRAVPATPDHVVRSDHGTTIANAFGVSVSTIEHLMAAFAITHIDNAFVDVSGAEIPILDGSAAPFVAGLQEAGLRAQAARRDELVIAEPVSLSDGDRSIEIEPAPAFSLSVEIDFEDCLIGRQTMSVTLRSAEEIARLASARTFCRLYEVDALRRAGLIRGGSLENSLVVDGERLLNDCGLRDPQEFALHKALDLIGDLYLVGMPIRGAIRATRPGHDINCRAALALQRAGAGVSAAASA